MRGLVVALIVLAAVAAAFAFGFINIDQTRDAKLPKVAVEGGQAPKFDVDTAKVNVGTRTTEIDVPVVGTKKEEVEVPTMDVQKAH